MSPSFMEVAEVQWRKFSLRQLQVLFPFAFGEVLLPRERALSSGRTRRRQGRRETEKAQVQGRPRSFLAGVRLHFENLATFFWI